MDVELMEGQRRTCWMEGVIRKGLAAAQTSEIIIFFFYFYFFPLIQHPELLLEGTPSFPSSWDAVLFCRDTFFMPHCHSGTVRETHPKCQYQTSFI